MKNKWIEVIFYFAISVTLVVLLSQVSVKIWGGKPEKAPAAKKLIIDQEMTLKEFGKENNIQNIVLKRVFKLTSPKELSKKLASFNMSEKELQQKISGSLAIESEKAVKNWQKILIKFFVWFLYLSFFFILTRKKRVKTGLRIVLYATGVFIFGIILGAEPSPMGTVKDAIFLYSSHRVIFLPRLIAFSVFILFVFIANKAICAWGCQFGLLQDFIFRLNRDKKTMNGKFLKQFKPSFALSNSIRIAFFVIFTLIAILWSLDIIEKIDPFKIFNPGSLTITAIVFIGGILILSLFTYRPWCTFFCPFGLVGWLVEKISIFKIKVNYDKCISCKLCEKSCPSHAMSAILYGKKNIPDCFSCSSCIEVCPTDAIDFSLGKRTKPPKDKFKNKDT